MKRTIWLCGILLCLLLIFNYYEMPSSEQTIHLSNEKQIYDKKFTDFLLNTDIYVGNIFPIRGYYLFNFNFDNTPSSEQTIHLSNEEQVYVKKYTDFLLNTDFYVGNDLPIMGFYLFDLNFDNIPELGVLHHSGGSMGGYFEYYCFDGNEIVSVLTNKNEPARISDYTKILADFENEKVYLLRESYLLQGNVEGTYGYVKEIINQNGIPCVYDIISLDINQEIDFEKYYGIFYEENVYLSDSKLNNCLITQYYFNGEWNEISPNEYLKLKKELISEENVFVDLRDIDVHILLWGSTNEIYDENGQYKNIKITEEEIDMLFLKWFKYIE